MYVKSFVKIFITILFFSLNFNLFSAGYEPGEKIYNTDPNAQENQQPYGEKKASASGVENGYVSSKKIQIGFYAGIGLTRQTSAHYTQGEIYTKLAFQFSALIQYFPLKHFGLEAEMGWQNFATKEIDSVTKNELRYNLQYFFISIAPLLEFSGIYFSFGIYFGFIMPNTTIEGSENYDDDLDKYTEPDFGVKMTAGYQFELSGKIDMFLGINVRAQVYNFRTYNESGSKIIAFYFNIGLLFDL